MAAPLEAGEPHRSTVGIGTVRKQPHSDVDGLDWNAVVPNTKRHCLHRESNNEMEMENSSEFFVSPKASINLPNEDEVLTQVRHAIFPRAIQQQQTTNHLACLPADSLIPIVFIRFFFVFFAPDD